MDPADLQFDSSLIDPPGDEEKFEIFCCALARVVWKDPTAERVGRSGQKQKGVDVSARYNMGVDYWGIQSKKRDAKLGTLSISDIKKEVSDAKLFKPALRCLYIATPLKPHWKLYWNF